MSASASRSRSSISAQARNRTNKENAAVQDAVPNEPETPQLAWRVLTKQHVSKLESLPVRELAKELAVILDLSFEEDLRDAAILDYYVAGYWFAKEKKFTGEQLSAFFTLLQIMIQNIKKEFSRDDTIKELRSHLAGVGVSKKTSLQCFSVKAAALAVQYFSSSIFKHYHLFKYLFSENQEEDHVSISLQVGLPPDPSSLCPAPLVEGVTKEFHCKYMAPPTSPLRTPSHSSQSGTEEGLINTEDGTEGSHAVVPGADRSDEGSSMLEQFSAEQIRTMIQSMSTEALKGYQEQVFQKLKSREDQLKAKLSKLEKKLT